MRVYSTEGKAVTLKGQGGGSGAKTGLYAEPINVTGGGKAQTLKAQYYKNSIANFVGYTSTYGATGVAEPSQKGVPKVYEVKDGFITIKDKQYPIKLADGFYIIRKLSVTECMRLQTVPEWYKWEWISEDGIDFKKGEYRCKNAKSRGVISQLQAEKLNSAINTTYDTCDTEQQNSLESWLTIRNVAKKSDATTKSKPPKVIVSSITKHTNEKSMLTEESALYVERPTDIPGETRCAVSIILNGCSTETLCIPISENSSLMEMLGVNTTKPLTEDGFIELLQKRCSAENSSQKRLSIISTLINWTMIRTIYTSATTKPTYIYIGSSSDWQQNSLQTELSFLKMGFIDGVSKSSAYKMLGNGWTCEVIAHLIRGILEDKGDGTNE